MLVRGKDQSWRAIGLADDVFQGLVRRVLAMAPEWRGEKGTEKRCLFFLSLFGHKDRALFELAYLELGRAPYSTIKRVAHLIPRERLQPILTRREYLEWRPLAILMLTQHADAADRALVKNRVDECSRLALTINLAAWVTAYIELDGVEAIATLDQLYLGNPERSEEEVRAILSALSVHGRSGHTHLRDQIVHSYGVAIRNHPTVIGPISHDLAEWRRPDYRLEVQAALERMDLKWSAEDRKAIRRYLALRNSVDRDSAVVRELND